MFHISSNAWARLIALGALTLFFSACAGGNGLLAEEDAMLTGAGGANDMAASDAAIGDMGQGGMGAEPPADMGAEPPADMGMAICADGEERACYSGPDGTANVGQCRMGTQQCEGDAFGACLGQVRPGNELCNLLDDDCDGQIDEDNICALCGNEVVEDGEQCDDGNMMNGDGCDANCQIEVGPARVLSCGNPQRSVESFLKPGDLPVVDGCAPDANVRALVIARSGAAQAVANPEMLRAYVQGGGTVLTEFSISDDIYNVVMDANVAEGVFQGGCQDNVNPMVQFNQNDPFWLDNPNIPPQPEQSSGCGKDMSDFPGITPLGGWSEDTVSLAYIDVGQGRLWLIDLDWQDMDRELSDASQLLMRYMILGIPGGSFCGDGNLDEGEGCDDGNLVDGDGCSEQCIDEGPACGNNVVDEGEECDDGNQNDGDGCSANCTIEPPELDQVLACGQTGRDVQTFLNPEDGILVVMGCAPTPKTQAIVVSRNGLEDAMQNIQVIQAYLAGGGNLLTEFNISDELFNALTGEAVMQGARSGDCGDQVNPPVRLNENDPFWQENGAIPAPMGRTGCGMDLSAFPGITALGGWDANSVSLAYIDIGQGRLWLVESDWSDSEADFMDDSRLLMRSMILHASSGHREFIGSFAVNDGPPWGDAVSVSCVQACAQLFGGDPVEYGCSTLDGEYNGQAFVDGWGDSSFCNGEGVAEDFALPEGGGQYNCGAMGCSYSAYVADHGCDSVNYCWR